MGAIDRYYRQMRQRGYFAPFAALVADVRSKELRRAPILMGPRRVGKTVLLIQLVQSLIDGGLDPRRVCYLSVEHPVYNGLGLDKLVELSVRASGGDATDLGGRVFIFDEIQYLKNWELHLKTLVDTYPRTTWIASGSAAAALRLRSDESGAGRFTDFLLPPLTFHEYLTLREAEGLVTPADGGWFETHDIGALNASFIDYLNFGGYPEVALSPTIQGDPGRYVRQDIIDKVLLRDLPSLYGIDDIQELNSLFTSLAYNTANEVSIDPLSQRANIAKNTIKRYLEYLEAAFLVKRIHRVDQHARRFQRATHFKIYLTNPSMRAALFSPVHADDDVMGAMVETAVFGQWFHGRTDSLHYARWRDGEIDLVRNFTDGTPAWVCEAKWSDRAARSPGELTQLVAFCKQHELASAIVTTRTEHRDVTIDGVQILFVPASLYCCAVGHSMVRGKLAPASMFNAEQGPRPPRRRRP